MKYLLSILFILTVLAIDPLPGPGTDTVQFNRTNKNVAPNGLNIVGNTVAGTNLQAQTSVSVGGSITTNTAVITTDTNNALIIIINLTDALGIPAFKSIITNSISLGAVQDWYNGTNLITRLDAKGDVIVGGNILDQYGISFNEILQNLRIVDRGDPSATGFYFENTDSTNYYADSWTEFHSYSSGTDDASGQFDLTAITSNGRAELGGNIGSSSIPQVDLRGLFENKGFYLRPTISDGGVAYTLQTVNSISSGIMLLVLNNTTTNFMVDPDSGWTGSGTNFFGDDGKAHNSLPTLTVTNLTVTSNFVFNTTIISNISQDSIWLPGDDTNVLAKLNGPFGTNLVQFGFNGQLIFGTNTVPNQTTSKFYIIQSYRDVSLGDPGQTLVELDQINSGSGDILQWLINMNGGNISFSRGAANGANTSSIEESITSTQAKMSFNNGIIVWGPGTTNVIYRSDADLIYTNSGTSPLFYVINTNGSSIAIGLNSSVGRLVASSGSIYSDGKFGANTAGPRTSMDILGSLAYQGDEISLTGDDTIITTSATSGTQKWLNSDNNTPANRTVHFNSSGIRGQVMDLIVTANAAQVLNADTVGSGAIKLSADWNGTTYSSLSLRSDGTNWIETARSVK